MYNTVREMHIALDMGLQQIDSNRKQSISPEHKDMALNYAVLQFVETRSNPKTNIKREGYEDTQKRYDDLRELKRSKELTTYDIDNKVFSILPVDYYKRISVGANVIYSKNELPSASNIDNYYYSILPFPDYKGKHTSDIYRDFTISVIADSNKETLFNINDFPNISKLYSSDAKFMIINLVLEHIRDIEVYWETWNNVYKANSFIFVRKDQSAHYRLSYKDIDGVISNNHSTSYNKYPDKKGILRPVDLFSSEDEFNTLTNPYYQKNKHLHPGSYIENSRIMVYNGDNFIIPGIVLTYLKKPRLINLKANQSCELSINREIIDLAIQKLKAYIKDEGYQHIVNESQIIE